MADTDESRDVRTQFLAPPVLAAIRSDEVKARVQMERTASQDIREERADLKVAAEQSPVVVVDIGLDGTVRWVSPSWKDVVGTTVESIQGKPIANILAEGSPPDTFANAVHAMKEDDSKSVTVRFKVWLGPLSVLRQDPRVLAIQGEAEGFRQDEIAEEDEDQILNLEGQGIMVYDRSSGGESHTMWMIKPSAGPREPKEITYDLPPDLVESLGFGAEVLASYLTALADFNADDPANHPPPLPILCRICERQIQPWWFERHSDLCLQEHRAEMEVQLAHEALMDHRHAIVKVLDALEARKSRPVSNELSLSPSPAPPAEYKGFPIGPVSSPSSSSTSGRASPATPPGSREHSNTGLGHARARSFAVRRPLSRIVELILDLCDTAIEIKIPVLSQSQQNADGDFVVQSPGSESRVSQVLGWQTPSSNTLDNEQGLALLSADTEKLAGAKVEATLRHRRIIEYSERIRIESHVRVQQCLDAALQKTANIREGLPLSDSSEEEDNAETPAPQNTAFFSDHCNGSSAMASAIRQGSNPSLPSDASRRQSVAISTGSNSPLECPTPRSNNFAAGILGRNQSISKHASLYGGSDAGDSDGSVPSSVFSGGKRTESPSSEQALGRSMSSRERKRRSLKLPGAPSPHRGTSPARPLPPASPLRILKARIPSGPDLLPSPVASPLLSHPELTSPTLSAHNHRRQSSVTSAADLLRNPPSPRLAALSQPPQRAVAPSIKDFEIIKPISKGAFGSVYLSKKKSTGDYFAIKVLKKSDMIAKNQVTNVKAERAIMMWQGESDFVAKLYWTFSSKDYLYLVMEYLNGGDCASLVKVLGGLPEDWARRYLAEVVLGVEHLHSRGIVHRDLKPDNLLIDQKGHLKLTDFGLSRMGLIGRQKRLMRSPNDSMPDLLKHGPFARPPSITSSRSASFDFQGNHSPSSTPIMTPDLAGLLGQPSYFSLSKDSVLGREHSRRASGYRSDSGSSDAFNNMFRNFSLDERTPIEEEIHAEDGDSPDAYGLYHSISHSSAGQHHTPPQASMLPPPMALFDPDDHNRRFVGTPDYLAPETINGLGQDEMSDWWSLGCILFEFLYGYPPFHADAPEKVFENILSRNIDWPPEEHCPVSSEARDLMNKLMTISPKERLGSNMSDRYASGGEEIRKHPWFDAINWETLLEDEAQFVPAPENPEDTEYFDTRGATLQSFAEEMEEQYSSNAPTPGADNYSERPHDALSRVRTQINSMTNKRGLMPLHIPAHVRDHRSRRLSEPVANDDFGTFAFKNLPVLEKANKDVIQKLRAEALNAQNKPLGYQTGSGNNSPAPSLDGSPMLPSPLKRTLSVQKGINRPTSPSNLSQTNSSPNRVSQPTSPLLVSFSTGAAHERRKTSSASSTLSHQSSASLQPGSFFDIPRLPTALTAPSATSSPIKSSRHSLTPGTLQLVASPDKNLLPQKATSITSRARSQTVGSQDGDTAPVKPFNHHKRRSQVFDVSPSSSDNEDPAKALLRVQRRRASSKKISNFNSADGPAFRPLDILICEDHPVSKLVMERLLEKLRCRTITAVTGPEAVRFATSAVQFDIIMMEVKLPQLNGADVARMIRSTTNPNQQTPIIAVTGYLKELPQNHHFDSLIEKPPTLEKLTNALCNLCQWKPPPADYHLEPLRHTPSGLRQESHPSEDSPSSQSSGPFTRNPGISYRASSREDSIGSSSFYGDMDSTFSDNGPVIISQQSDDWAGGLGINTEEHDPKQFIHPGLPHLLHYNSAPPILDLPVSPRKQRSIEAIKAKRENLEKKRHECAESGDDEDEELGDIAVQPKSPRNRHRGSKLGTEMLRTNSRGSVISASEESTERDTPVPPPSNNGEEQNATITPPVIFPKAAGEAVKDIDMDATPRPPTTQTEFQLGDSYPKESPVTPLPPVKSA